MTHPLPQNWQAIKLREIIQNLVAGVSVNSTDKEYDDAPLYILKTSAVSKGNFDINERKIVRKDARNRVKTSVSKDSILISRMNTPALVGDTCYVSKDFPETFLPDRLWQAVVVGASARWLNYLFQASDYRRKIKDCAGGTSGSMKNISKKALLALSLNLPPSDEQSRIVAVLETWDDAIEKLENNIELKKSLKIGMEKRLLTGKLRLPGFTKKWETVQMSDLFERITRTVTSTDPLQSYSISSKIGFETQEEKYSRVMSGQSLEKYIHLKKGEFAYNKGNSLTYPHGCIYEFEKSDGLVPFVYICFRNKGHVSSSFYKHYFLQRLLDKELKRHITTSVRGNGLLNISPENFFSCKVLMPPIEEQKAIAKVLDAIDTELHLLVTKLEYLKQQKIYLLNNLISGRIRPPENMSLPNF